VIIRWIGKLFPNFARWVINCGPYWLSKCWKCRWSSAYCHLSDLWITMYRTTGYVLFFSTAAIRYNWVEVTLFSVVVLVIVQGVQNGGPHFQFTSFEEAPFLVFVRFRRFASCSLWLHVYQKELHNETCLLYVVIIIFQHIGIFNLKMRSGTVMMKHK